MEPVQNVLPAIVDARTKVLIVGSMPGIQSLEKQQYYGNPRNHFWAILGELLGVAIPESYPERIELVKEHRIGLWDVIQTCERKGSLDSAIKNEIPNDFGTLFEEYPQIELILFNGTKSFDVFRKKIGFELLAGRAFEKMPSTSPVPGKNIQTFPQKVESWRILTNYL